jgi:hypothetical protein
VILRSNESLGRGKPPSAVRAKGVEKEEEVEEEYKTNCRKEEALYS